ncbi:prepilin-type N-terminal cleavage/methylation domain-containing protein [Thalassotalea aquiviva]|uniref:type IV pilus modification PilV family protein n=1 Tax=Thalassotalea aquiviva TaxID=3242415 RepID=UPI00352AEC4B
MRVKQKGITLIELIVAMTIMAILAGFLISALLPREKQSVDHLQLIKAVTLAQSLINEIRLKAFDEHSTSLSEFERCNDSRGIIACTGIANFGPDAGETSRLLFDDVDDYHFYQGLEDSNGSDISAIYPGFKVLVQVTYDNDYSGATAFYDGRAITDESLVKQIRVIVTTEFGTEIVLATHKANL